MSYHIPGLTSKVDEMTRDERDWWLNRLLLQKEREEKAMAEASKGGK